MKQIVANFFISCLSCMCFLSALLQRSWVAMDPFSQLILTISVTSFLTFQWLFHKVSPWVSTRISPGFLGLSDKQKVEWNSRCS